MSNVVLNKNDKSTVISIIGYDIDSFKPGLYPGRFHISAGSEEHPSFLEVGCSVHYVSIQDDMPQLPVITPSFEVARSIVDDYKRACVSTTISTGPGIMYHQGCITEAEFRIKYAKEYKSLIDSQRNWWRLLVQLADDDWKRYKSHKAISDSQRAACIALQLDREWLIQVIQSGIKCPACMTINTSEVVICTNCKCVLKLEEYKKLQFA